MKPRAVFIAALILVATVVAIIRGWATAGDRASPMSSEAFYQWADF
jgi:hypothetical protein